MIIGTHKFADDTPQCRVSAEILVYAHQVLKILERFLWTGVIQLLGHYYSLFDNHSPMIRCGSGLVSGSRTDELKNRITEERFLWILYPAILDG
jgi:hypothetical protein